MKIVIVSQHGAKSTKEVNFVPSPGMRIDLGWYPCPFVKDVISYPLPETLRNFGVNDENIDAVVRVE